MTPTMPARDRELPPVRFMVSASICATPGVDAMVGLRPLAVPSGAMQPAARQVSAMVRCRIKCGVGTKVMLLSTKSWSRVFVVSGNYNQVISNHLLIQDLTTMVTMFTLLGE
jgi:hypothetical protein